MHTFMFREVNNSWLMKCALLVFVLDLDVASLHFRLFLGLRNLKYSN
jgi:hypothetical protein